MSSSWARVTPLPRLGWLWMWVWILSSDAENFIFPLITLNHKRIATFESWIPMAAFSRSLSNWRDRLGETRLLVPPGFRLDIPIVEVTTGYTLRFRSKSTNNFRQSRKADCISTRRINSSILFSLTSQNSRLEMRKKVMQFRKRLLHSRIRQTGRIR